MATPLFAHEIAQQIRGDYDWKIPEGPAGAMGFLAYHPEDQYSGHAFLSGVCSLPNDIYDDAWRRVESSNYNQCWMNVEVGPVKLSYEEAVWERAASKFLYNLDLEFSFYATGSPTVPQCEQMIKPRGWGSRTGKRVQLIRPKSKSDRLGPLRTFEAS